jgi:hypothetical protein
MAQQGCFVCRAGGVRCHILIAARPGQVEALRASSWVQDGLVIRPLLSESGQPIEISAEDEGTVVAKSLDVLERRFGPISDKPVRCPDGGHIQAKAAPLKWKDQLN